MNVDGTWQKVGIVEKESEYLYKVHYLGKSDSADEWLSASQIKRIEPLQQLAQPIKEEPNLSSTVNCSYNAPVGQINNAEKFSEKVAKRRIYEWLLNKEAGQNSKTGISYLYYQAQQPYINEVSVSASKGLLLKNNVAPAGAMIYPVRMKYRICKQMDGKNTTAIVDCSFNCFRNSKGFWECPAELVQ